MQLSEGVLVKMVYPLGLWSGELVKSYLDLASTFPQMKLAPS